MTTFENCGPILQSSSDDFLQCPLVVDSWLIYGKRDQGRHASLYRVQLNESYAVIGKPCLMRQETGRGLLPDCHEATVGTYVTFFQNTSRGLAVIDDSGHFIPLVVNDSGESLFEIGATVWLDGCYRMWFSSAYEQRSQDFAYGIKYAESADGIHWDVRASILRPDGKSCYRPVFWLEDNQIKIIYSERPLGKGARYRLMCAESLDGVTWDLLGPLNVDRQEWDRQMQCYPWIDPTGAVLVYNGNEYGRRSIGVARRIR